jgi:mannose-6-phosphate isomerase class I
MKTTYRKNPFVEILGVDAEIFSGFEAIRQQLSEALQTKRVIAIETYPATDKAALIEGLKELKFDAIIDTDQANKSNEELNAYLFEDLTDDRVFGHLTHKSVDSLTNPTKYNELKDKINQQQGRVLLIGLGSSRFVEDPIIVFTSVSRWEIQMRYRSKKYDNYNAGNFGEDSLRMFKRGYFVDWRIADNYKDKLWNRIDYYMDTDKLDHPNMMKQEAYQQVLLEATSKPISLIPYFDPGVWGGHWMQEKFGLDADKPNFAWSFNGLPEENAVVLKLKENTMKVQAMDLVLFASKQLLGEKTMARFGREFPIRFDLLDTMGGGNLSLQVHPKEDYAMRNFGLHYTQNESYYILDAKENADVYLGVKDNIKFDELMADLRVANSGGEAFNDEKYINKIPAKKHDHFSIPAGTIHCSGKDTMVLEISATPYIFTFKLWDWGRLGLDGIPRPVHLDHGAHAIDMSRTTDWVMDNLVNDIVVLEEKEGVKRERTGLHETEFIDTERVWFDKAFTTKTGNTFHTIMLIEGDSASITSDDQSFEAMTINYAECFIIPAHVNSFTITPHEGSTFAIIDAYVRNTKMGER